MVQKKSDISISAAILLLAKTIAITAWVYMTYRLVFFGEALTRQRGEVVSIHFKDYPYDYTFFVFMIIVAGPLFFYGYFDLILSFVGIRMSLSRNSGSFRLSAATITIIVLSAFAMALTSFCDLKVLTLPINACLVFFIGFVIFKAKANFRKRQPPELPNRNEKR